MAFSVAVPRPVQAEAASQQVRVISSSIIYRLMDDVKARVIALLPPVIERRVTGEANVLQLFDIHLPGRKILKVAGCRVSNGVVEKNKFARVVRDGETIHDGKDAVSSQNSLLIVYRRMSRDFKASQKGYHGDWQGDRVWYGFRTLSGSPRRRHDTDVSGD